MIYRPTSFVRVLEVRLEHGERLPQALLALARWERVDAARVRGQGLLEAVELEVDGARLALGGRLELASLSGALVVRGDREEATLHAVVAVRSGAGGVPEVHAGRVLSARALDASLTLDVVDDAPLEWRFDPATGRRA